jgi:hypothetical protein
MRCPLDRQPRQEVKLMNQKTPCCPIAIERRIVEPIKIILDCEKENGRHPCNWCWIKKILELVDSKVLKALATLINSNDHICYLQ